MKVWIIYDSKFGYCKRLAETLEDLLEGDCDISVGYAKKISPSDVLAESPDAVLVGGPIHFGKPSRVISSWIKSCYALTRSSGSLVSKTFAFTTWNITRKAGFLWQNIFQKYTFAASCFPEVLSVKINPKSKPSGLELSHAVYDLIENLRRYLIQTK